jgi:K+/H+ antiporter YhaU regulatory subunit KhtT
MSETKALGMKKALSDVTTIAETFTNAVKYARSYADTVTPTETTARTVGKALADTTTITESLTKVMTYLRSLSDTTAATDAGSIFYANYVGPSYFEADYVGSTTTF